MRSFKILLAVVAVIVFGLYGAVRVRDSLLTDHTAPVISFDSDTVTVSVGDDESALLAGVTAQDNRDGDLSGQVMVRSISQFIEPRTALVSYIVFDAADNIGTASRNVVYSDYRSPHFALREPLIYRVGSTVTLTDRLSADDVLDGDLSGSIRLVSSNFNNTAEGTGTLTVQVTNSMGDAVQLELPVIFAVLSPQDPEITLTDALVYLPVGADFRAEDYLAEVTDPLYAPTAAGDEEEGEEPQTVDLRGAVTVDSNVDTGTPGSYRVFYTYQSGDGTTARTAMTALTVVVEEQ